MLRVIPSDGTITSKKLILWLSSNTHNGSKGFLIEKFRDKFYIIQFDGSGYRETLLRFRTVSRKVATNNEEFEKWLEDLLNRGVNFYWCDSLSELSSLVNE